MWSALCLLLGKTVELGREKPDRMKPALPLSDPFFCLDEKDQNVETKPRKRAAEGGGRYFSGATTHLAVVLLIRAVIKT